MIASNVDYVKYIWSMRAPIFLLAAIWAAPKVTLLWILVVLLKPLCSLFYKRLPLEWQNKTIQSIPLVVKRSVFLRDLGVGADQCLPFITFLVVPVLRTICGAVDRRSLGTRISPVQTRADQRWIYLRAKQKTRSRATRKQLLLLESLRHRCKPAFFALGIPAFFSYSLYQNLNIEKQCKQVRPQKPSIANPTFQLRENVLFSLVDTTTISAR